MAGYVNAAGVEKIAQLCQQLVNAGGIVLDQTPTQNSTNAVESGGVYTALQGKQNTLTFDSAPTDGSSNPVTSDGIYTALDDKQNAITAGTGLEFSGDTLNHSNSVTAGTIGSSSASSGATIAIPYATFDAQGHIKTKGTHTHTIDSLAASAIDSGTLNAARIPTLAATKIEPIYYQAHGSGTVTATAGEQIQVPLVTSGALYDGSGLSIASSGIKIATAGRYRISGAVYIRNASGMTARGCYIKRSTSSGAYSASTEIITATEEGNVAGAVNAGPKVVQCAANDIIYLAGRSVGAASVIEKANVGTYLLVERLS